MHTQEIHVTGARGAVREIRLRLFAFSEVLDVLPTSRLDSLVVVVVGRPRPAEWGLALRAAGYEVLRPLAARPAAERPDSDRLRPVGVQEPEDGCRPLPARRRRSSAHLPRSVAAR
ncbi:MAG: hypothetical protein JWO21_1454 [Solirubrobacterales bacterium]|jgi:hypothetical protein|nr:hypothetical protein [Solirubrobacterales bacterium]